MVGSFVFAQERFIVERWSSNWLLLIQTVERCGHAVLRCPTTLSGNVQVCAAKTPGMDAGWRIPKASVHESPSEANAIGGYENTIRPSSRLHQQMPPKSLQGES